MTVLGICLIVMLVLLGFALYDLNHEIKKNKKKNNIKIISTRFENDKDNKK